MAKHTNAERVFRALERKQPDRIPHYEQGIHPKIMNEILPGASYEEFMIFAINCAYTRLKSEYEQTKGRR